MHPRQWDTLVQIVVYLPENPIECVVCLTWDRVQANRSEELLPNPPERKPIALSLGF